MCDGVSGRKGVSTVKKWEEPSFVANPVSNVNCPICQEQGPSMSPEAHYRNLYHQSTTITVARSKGKPRRRYGLNRQLRTQLQDFTHLYDEVIRKNDANELDTNTMKRLIADMTKSKKKIQLAQKSHQMKIEAHQMNSLILRNYCEDVMEEYSMKKTTGTIQGSNDVYCWKLDNVDKKIDNAKKDLHLSLFSPPCFTDLRGYKFSIRLYLNGDGAARGTHLSVFLVLLSGPDDPLLEWPFKYRVSFCLVDQRALLENSDQKSQNVIASFRPDPKSNSFQKPSSSMNIASGVPRLVELSEINKQPELNRFKINDTLFIKVFIDFNDVPRSVLPFIFDIDSSLPAHVQRHKIDAEIQRLRLEGKI